MSEPNITAYVNNSFSFLKPVYYVYSLFNTDCLSPIFFSLGSLGDVDFSFSLYLGTKANSVEWGTTADA